jgi:3D (Asp-Asp-Asp) domain-containing protein
MLLAAAALTTPLFNADSAPKAKTFKLSAYMTPLTAGRRATPRVSKAKALIARSLTYTVTATVYEAVPSQTDDDPFVTADNSRIKPHYGSKKRWMALSRDLLKKWGGQFDYGDKVRVKGISPKLDGVYTVHDTMNKRHRHCMDILAHTSENLDVFTKGVKIQKVAYR